MSVWQAKEAKRRVAIVSGVRTPFTKAGTALKECSASHLGVTAAREVMARVEISPERIDEVVFGNTGTPADSANISRIIALRCGFPDSISAYTVHRNCAAANEAVAQACMKIGYGINDIMLVGGTESMSNMPLLFGDEMTDLIATLTMSKSPAQKIQKLTNFRPGWLKPVVAIMEGLTDPISGLNMGLTAEILARDFHISRLEQDTFAMNSHNKTVEAQKEGKFEEEIFPVMLEPKYSKCQAIDVGPRDGQTVEKLARLKPFFDKKNGTVTPGNACPITDGAGAFVMMSEDQAKAEGYEILGLVSAWAFAGCDPARMGLGPVYSTAKVLKATGRQLSEMEVVELNEAFSAQVIACQRAFASKQYCEEKLGWSGAIGEIEEDRLNPNGGAVALGHPVGATGIRIILTCLLEMKRRNAHTGLSTLCVGGGQGGAFILERE